MVYLSQVGGCLLGGPRRAVYVKGTGIEFELLYRDDMLCNSDNEFDLTFVLSDAALTVMAGTAIDNAVDALAIFHRKKNKVLAAIAKGLDERGLFSPGARPRAIPVQDLVLCVD